jgi:hypothetical protein
MKNKKTRAKITLLTALFSACTSVGVSKPVDIPADIAGLVHAGQTNSQEEYALLDHLGANWILATFYWGNIEPSNNQWDFDSYDKYVNTAKEAGKKVLGILGYDAAWIHDKGKSRKYIPPDKLHFFLEYVRQTSAHFRGRVDAWCIWNEPNFLFWQGSKEEYFELARQAADALREIDPDVILLGGAFNRNITGLPQAYIRGLFESGAMEKADAIAFHPYELNPQRTVKLFNKFRDLVDKYGFTERIWVTEVGYPTAGWYPTAVSEKKFPAHIVKTFVNLAAAGAKKIFWYQLSDPVNRVKSNSEDFFGLVRSDNDYTSKGAEAYRLCAVYLAGTLYRPDLPLRENIPSSLQSFYFEKPEGGTLVLWKEGAKVRVSLQIPGSGSLHDPVSGNAVDIGLERDITVGSMPVFVTFENGNQKCVIRK